MRLEFVILAVLLIATMTRLGMRVRFLKRRNEWLQGQLNMYRGKHRQPARWGGQ